MATESLHDEKVNSTAREARDEIEQLRRRADASMRVPTAARRPESGFLALSFVRRHKRPEKDSAWYLPRPPDNYVEARRVNADGSRNSRDVALYGIGCDQGTAAAREYISALRSAPRRIPHGWLQHCVLDMLDAPRSSLLRGQIVGFFCTLEAEVIA